MEAYQLTAGVAIFIIEARIHDLETELLELEKAPQNRENDAKKRNLREILNENIHFLKKHNPEAQLRN